ncbi:unnamed protein product [Caretta caretta]
MAMSAFSISLGFHSCYIVVEQSSGIETITKKDSDCCSPHKYQATKYPQPSLPLPPHEYQPLFILLPLPHP